jgi:hypothetical protein
MKDRTAYRNSQYASRPKSKAHPATDTPDLNHIAGTWVDRGAGLLFDWLWEPPGQTTQQRYKLFSEPIGATKPPWRTNMRTGGILLPPMGFILVSIHCFYGRMTDNDQRQFQENYLLRLLIDSKCFYDVPLIAIPWTGIFLPASNPTTPLQPGVLGEHFAKYIGPLQPFWIELLGEPFTTEATGTGLRFLPVLNGYLDRSVQ